MAAQIRAIGKLGLFPETMKDVPYDQTPVDRAAKAVAILMEEEGTGHIWHIMDPHIRYLDQLTNARAVEDRAFAARLSDLKSDRDCAIWSVYWRMRLNGFNTRFDFTKTLRELDRLGFVW